MIAGVPKETYPGERRIAITPMVVGLLQKAGIETLVEAGAGLEAGYPDAAYTDRGAKIAATRQEVFDSANLILQVRAAGSNPEAGSADHAMLKPTHTVIAFCDPLGDAKSAEAFAKTGATLLSMELMPRITRAQSMDALSSMATIAGYKAVLMAADQLPKMFPMMMTAAGTVKPAKVMVIGAGVAGLQAISSARKLGAVVEAYDIRPAVKEQIESLGAKFVELDLDTSGAEDAGGYAKEQSEDFLQRQREAMGKVIAENDVVIATAAVPGRKAPVIVTADMVRGMATGSVIIDIAAETGGNCELTRAGETVVDGGVSIVGPTNLGSSIPYHASQMYSKNMTTFVQHLAKSMSEDGKQLQFDMDDEITVGTLVTKDGAVVHERVREALGSAPAAQ